jgi:hypothetical protein
MRKSLGILLIASSLILCIVIAGCTQAQTLPSPTAKPTPVAASGAPVWPTSVTAAPTNPCVTCTCPYVMDDQYNVTDTVNTNTRGYRYMELFVTCPGAKNAGIYNTMTFNIQPDNSRDSAPDILWANYSDTRVAQDYKADGAYSSGIRFWLHDKMRLTWSNNVRSMSGLDTRWGANAGIDADALSKGEQFYSYTQVATNRTWYYDAGKPVFILDAPNGMTFVMQSYSIAVDKNQTYEDLPNLGSKLKLPEGWKFRTVTLPKDLTVNGITCDGQPNQWTVTQDELINTYSACWECGGQSSCNYRP